MSKTEVEIDQSTFESLKNSKPEQLLTRLREEALAGLRKFEDLDDGEKSDAFTVDIKKFAEALEAAGSFAEIRSYVLRGVQWNARDTIRKKARRAQREVSIESLSVDPTGSHFGEVPWQTVTSDLSPTSEAAMCIRRIVSSLNRSQKELFDLCYEKKLTPDKVASHYGVPIGTIYTRKSRLVSRLKRLANDPASGCRGRK